MARLLQDIIDDILVQAKATDDLKEAPLISGLYFS